ncbi:hypothetical protein MPHO_52350 [Mycolicibacterium phocaicum]|nr:hypothetical protein MPHO_52350 [Mycolicibacterium phocaicum]
MYCGECLPQYIDLVSPDLRDEVDQGRMPVTLLGGLSERVDHEAGHQLITAARRDVTVCPIIAELADHALAGESAEHRHNGGVREFAFGADGVMDLANGLRPVRVPEVIHHLAFQIAQVPQHGHRPSLSGALGDLGRV